MELSILLHHRRGTVPTESRRSVLMKEFAFAFACILWIATLIPVTVSKLLPIHSLRHDSCNLNLY